MVALGHLLERSWSVGRRCPGTIGAVVCARLYRVLYIAFAFSEDIVLAWFDL